MSRDEPDVCLRPAGAEDEGFLFEVFAATRAAGLRAAGLAQEALGELLALQFRGQQAQYRAAHPDAEWSLVLLDGVRVGYWCVERREEAIMLVDVALLPGHTGQGVGGRLLRGLVEEGDAAGLPVLAHVDKANPARRLYARLGFETRADDGVRLAIRRAPSGQA
jgi:GNAT superfamily N-acetyltransferase